MHGSQVYMSRTKAEVSPEVMSSGSHWEFFAGNDGVRRHDIAVIWVAFFSISLLQGKARWADDIADAAPIFTWENRTVR